MYTSPLQLFRVILQGWGNSIIAFRLIRRKQLDSYTVNLTNAHATVIHNVPFIL